MRNHVASGVLFEEKGHVTPFVLKDFVPEV